MKLTYEAVPEQATNRRKLGQVAPDENPSSQSRNDSSCRMVLVPCYNDEDRERSRILRQQYLTPIDWDNMSSDSEDEPRKSSANDSGAYARRVNARSTFMPGMAAVWTDPATKEKVQGEEATKPEEMHAALQVEIDTEVHREQNTFSTEGCVQPRSQGRRTRPHSHLFKNDNESVRESATHDIPERGSSRFYQGGQQPFVVDRTVFDPVFAREVELEVHPTRDFNTSAGESLYEQELEEGSEQIAINHEFARASNRGARTRRVSGPPVARKSVTSGTANEDDAECISALSAYGIA